MTLSTGCAAIDAGAILPNINDGYAGLAPDLGAYEIGAAAAVVRTAIAVGAAHANRTAHRLLTLLGPDRIAQPQSFVFRVFVP